MLKAYLLFALFAALPAHADLINLPADDAAHPGSANLPEWWYYNGHLSTKSGASYGFELVFFQYELLGVPTRAVQFALTDIGGKHFSYHTWVFPGNYTDVKNGFNLTVPGGPTAVGGNGTDQLQAKLPDGTTLELQLNAIKHPVLEMGTGEISVTDPATGTQIANELYYSRTRMDTAGTLTIGGVSEPIGGESWFDHEWGKLTRAGWVWYSVQLDNGQEIMAYDMFDKAGQSSTFLGAEVVGTCFDCGNLVVGPGQFSMPFSGAWKSPHTGITYPTQFSFEIPETDMQLELVPILEDQEMQTPLLPTYWEGPVTVSGIEHGKPVTGKGYIELTGF